MNNKITPEALLEIMEISVASKDAGKLFTEFPLKNSYSDFKLEPIKIRWYKKLWNKIKIFLRKPTKNEKELIERVAVKSVQDILYDFTDRRGLKQERYLNVKDALEENK